MNPARMFYLCDGDRCALAAMVPVVNYLQQFSIAVQSDAFRYQFHLSGIASVLYAHDRYFRGLDIPHYCLVI